MSVLITGINGFIGKRLSKELQNEKNGIVLGYDRGIMNQAKKDSANSNFDVTSQKFYKDYHDEKIDFIIHLEPKRP